MGGGPSSETVTQNNPLTTAEIPYVTQNLGQAYGTEQGALSGQSLQYYPNDTYQPLIAGQETALNTLTNLGMPQGEPAVTSALQSNQNINNTGYSADPSLAGFSNFQAGNTGGQNILSMLGAGTTGSEQGLGGIGGGAGPLSAFSNGTASAYNPLNYFSSGSAINPYINAVDQSVVANTLPGIDSNFAAAGRSDSGLASNAESQGLGTALGSVNSQLYNTQSQEQLAAAQSLAGTQEQAAASQAGNELSAFSNLGNLQLGGAGALTNSELAGTTGLGNQYVNDVGNQIRNQFATPSLETAQLSGANTALGAQTEYQANAQNQLNANISAWNYGQGLPENLASWYSGLINGTPGGGSSSTTTPYNSNSTASTLAGVTGGIGALAGIGNIGVGGGATVASSIGPWLAGLSIFSDRRVKQDIRRVGITDGGAYIYTFRYINDPARVTHMGVIAQELMEHQPEAVFETPGGILAVDYNLVK